MNSAEPFTKHQHPTPNSKLPDKVISKGPISKKGFNKESKMSSPALTDTTQRHRRNTVPLREWVLTDRAQAMNGVGTTPSLFAAPWE